MRRFEEVFVGKSRISFSESLSWMHMALNTQLKVQHGKMFTLLY